jgi:hypothetical protein
MHLEGDVREEVALVEAVEIDLEDAPDVWLIVRMVVESHTVHLDGPVVPRRVRCRRRTGAPIHDGKQNPC